jgi:probable HAF family extracellular repeat protein
MTSSFLYPGCVLSEWVGTPETLKAQARTAGFMFLLRQINAVLSLVTLLFLGTAPIKAADSYTIINLGTLPGRSSSMIRGINSAGHVAGRSGTPANSATRAFVWSGGTIQSLGVLPGGEVSEATSINDIDHVVGASNTATRIRAFRWTSSTGMQDLGALPGDTASQAFGVNRAGVVAGFSTGPRGTRAVVWDQNSTIESLGTLSGGNSSRANGISDSGSVVGSSKTSSGRTHAFLWTRKDGMQDLGTLPGDLDSDALAINNAGQVAGFSNGSTGSRAVLWNNFRIQSLGFLPGGEVSQAMGINQSGTVVGLSTVDSGATHAFIWTASDGIRDLNELIPPAADILLAAAVGINARGQIVAFGGNRRTYDHDTPISIYLLTPAP